MEEERQQQIEEDRKYENIIANCSYEQLVYEQAILDIEETNLYNRKKALKEEFKRRLRGNK